MMQEREKVKAYLERQLGAPYVFGGTGKPCTPAYRRMRMAQYPAYAEKTKSACPALSGKAAGCGGCPYQNRLCFDCAQLARFALLQLGLRLPSGASSQWKHIPPCYKGAIEDMPKTALCLVFRKAGEKMAHVGIYTGDGTVYDARGYHRGVVKSALSAYPWTHFADIEALYLKQKESEAKPMHEKENPQNESPKTNAPTQNSRLPEQLYQSMLMRLGFSLAPFGADGKFGPVSRSACRAFQKKEGLPASVQVDPLTLCHLIYRSLEEKKDETAA